MQHLNRGIVVSMFMTTGRAKEKEGGETFLLSPYNSPAAVLTEPPRSLSVRLPGTP